MAYAYAWDKDVRVSMKPALEAHYRAASIAAAAWLEDHKEDVAGAPPHFSGGQHASAVNASAEALAAAASAALSTLPALERVDLAEVLTFACRGALLVGSHGFGEAGWAALAATLPGAVAAAKAARARR